MFIIIVIIISAGTAALPFLLPRLIRNLNQRAEISPSPAWLAIVAGLFFFGSFYLPDIHISNETDTFQQHFVGGGVYAALIFEYLWRLFGFRTHLIAKMLLLFAFVSTLGVASELAEFTISHLRIMTINTSDTSWDLLANTTGAITGFGGIRLCDLLRLNKSR